MKNGYKLFWTELADKELEEAIAYLEENWTDREIKNLFVKLDTTLKILASNPFIFQISDIEEDIRRAVVAKYNSLYYRINDNSIEIISFYNNRKNPNKRNAK
ncbi:type II toxin-antitoxin system RelE/ParE family toxin [Flavobacterium sp. DGU11]|uniref:Type II toxin-antitoxin system RelE/ParE family toxin n=1 Tax=Flavobacterium arundinis TaxID=3139143 RepID=A0ABU9HUJ3_9FLAO